MNGQFEIPLCYRDEELLFPGQLVYFGWIQNTGRVYASVEARYFGITYRIIFFANEKISY